jgi:hypothetical protein
MFIAFPIFIRQLMSVSWEYFVASDTDVLIVGGADRPAGLITLYLERALDPSVTAATLSTLTQISGLFLGKASARGSQPSIGQKKNHSASASQKPTFASIVAFEAVGANGFMTKPFSWQRIWLSSTVSGGGPDTRPRVFQV